MLFWRISGFPSDSLAELLPGMEDGCAAGFGAQEARIVKTWSLVSPLAEIGSELRRTHVFLRPGPLDFIGGLRWLLE